ncbi:MAG: ZIP family metal transporter [Planctomycetota bacterium]
MNLLAAVLPATVPSAATLGVYLLLIALAAIAGGSSVAFLSLGHRTMQVLLSFTGGVLLGVGLLHLLPHAALELAGDIDVTMGWALAGFVAMFLLERAFHGHAHHAADSACDHEHDGHQHGHHHHGHRAPAAARGPWAWCGAFAGLALHSLADGAALAASVGADAAHGAGQLAGVATFLAILLHKPLDAAIIAALMTEAGASRGLRLAAIVAYALIVPLGAISFLVSLPLFGGQQAAVLGVALAVAGGAFVCIAAADLLPEVQFHTHDRLLLTTALALGLAMAWGITVAERSSHGHSLHDHGSAPAAATPRPI